MAAAKEHSEKDTLAREQLLWGCGKAFLISQWFTNGTIGSTWLPELAGVGPLMGAGQLLIYLIYCALLLVVGFVVHDRLRDPRTVRAALIASVAVIGAGDAIVMLVGVGMLAAPWYVAGMLLIGAGMVLPMLSWGTYYCVIGEWRTAVILSLSWTVGSLLSFVIITIGMLSPPFAIALQLACIPLAFIFLERSWRCVADEPVPASLARRMPEPLSPVPLVNISDTNDVDAGALDLRRTAPFLLTVLVFGLVFGAVIGLNNVQDVASPLFVWTIGGVALSAVVFLSAYRSRSYSLGMLARALVPVTVVAAYLFPLFASNAAIVSVLGCAGYTMSLIFYQTATTAIARTGEVPVLKLIVATICVDSLGIVVGEYVLSLVLGGASVPLVVTYSITFVITALVIVVGTFALRDRSTVSLWGFKREATPRETVEQRCMELAAANGLTLRETEVMCQLAMGLEPQAISKELDISLATVRTHARNIYAKLDIHSQPDLIRRVVFEEG